MSRRLRRIVLGAFVATLVTVPTAGAKVYLSGVPETTVPGAVVDAYVSGCEAAPACGPTVRGVWVFLIRPKAGPMSFSTLPKPRWFVGKVNATGKLRFKVPRVREGTYRLIARLTLDQSRPQYLPASRVFRIQAPSR